MFHICVRKNTHTNNINITQTPQYLCLSPQNMMSKSAFCSSCHKFLSEDSFGTKRDGSRKRMCREDLAKAYKAYKPTATDSEADIISYSDLIEELVSHEQSRSVAINLADDNSDETLRNSAAISSADLNSFSTEIINHI